MLERFKRHRDGAFGMIEIHLEDADTRASLLRHIRSQLRRFRSSCDEFRLDCSADDVLQSTIVLALSNKSHFQEDRNPSAWLERIATNRIYNVLRRRSPRGDQVRIADFERFADQALAFTSQGMGWLWEEVERLPLRDQKIITAKFLRGLTGQGFVAEIEATSAKQANRWLSDALARLRRRLVSED